MKGRVLCDFRHNGVNYKKGEGIVSEKQLLALSRVGLVELTEMEAGPVGSAFAKEPSAKKESTSSRSEKDIKNRSASPPAEDNQVSELQDSSGDTNEKMPVEDTTLLNVKPPGDADEGNTPKGLNPPDNADEDKTPDNLVSESLKQPIIPRSGRGGGKGGHHGGDSGTV